jgi:hypothetical protein
MIYIGVDVGLDGAIAFINDAKESFNYAFLNTLNESKL